MMIKEQVKALWKICFDDSEEFVEMYFRLRYKTEVNVAIQSGEEVISALQMLPYPMTFGGETVQTSYISGACTHPDFHNAFTCSFIIIFIMDLPFYHIHGMLFEASHIFFQNRCRLVRQFGFA